MKFAGCYHGHVDSLLAAAGSGSGHLRGARHARRARGLDRVDPRAAVQRPGRGTRGIRRRTATEIACVITEAAAGNMGAVAPVDGFNAALAELCREHGALFISDEVMTGFRVCRSGYWGIDGAVEGWTPGPDDVRQGDGWRLPRCRLRWPRRRDGAAWRRSGRSTRPAPCRATRSPRPPGSPPCDWPPPRSTTGSTWSPPRSRPWSPMRSAPQGVPHVVQAAGQPVQLLLRRATSR